MPSRYDYPDPGTDPAYCDGLAPDDDTLEICLWCGEWHNVNPNAWPYCSTLCAARAAVDSEEG